MQCGTNQFMGNWALPFGQAGRLQLDYRRRRPSGRTTSNVINGAAPYYRFAYEGLWGDIHWRSAFMGWI